MPKRASTPTEAATHRYGVADVEKLLRLPRSTIRGLIAAGFVSPARGPRNAWLFSFQDLIVLRTAQALADAQVPRRRITKSLKDLRRHLPDEMPLSGLSLCAVADRVVIRERGSLWQAESGQYLLEFEGDPADGSLNVIENPPEDEAPDGAPDDAEAWFERGVGLESADPDGALLAYGQAIAFDPAFLNARINLGRLLHEGGRHVEAERVYRDAVKVCGGDPVLLYNLAVLLDDMDRGAQAVEAYEAALRGDPDLEECHYNLALLYEKLRKPKDAIRHMSRYRALTRARST